MCLVLLFFLRIFLLLNASFRGRQTPLRRWARHPGLPRRGPESSGRELQPSSEAKIFFPIKKSRISFGTKCGRNPNPTIPRGAQHRQAWPRRTTRNWRRWSSPPKVQCGPTPSAAGGAPVSHTCFVPLNRSHSLQYYFPTLFFWLSNTGQVENVGQMQLSSAFLFSQTCLHFTHIHAFALGRAYWHLHEKVNSPKKAPPTADEN